MEYFTISDRNKNEQRETVNTEESRQETKQDQIEIRRNSNENNQNLSESEPTFVVTQVETRE